VEEAEAWLLDTGYWILVTGYWLLDTGYWLLDAGYRSLDTDNYPLQSVLCRLVVSPASVFLPYTVSLEPYAVCLCPYTTRLNIFSIS